MDPQLHTPDPPMQHDPEPEATSDPAPIPDFTTNLDIQANPFFRFTTPEDFSSSDDESAAEPDPDFHLSVTEEAIGHLKDVSPTIARDIPLWRFEQLSRTHAVDHGPVRAILRRGG